MQRKRKRRRPMSKQKLEFDNFDATMKQLVRVPHGEIKAKLDAEKAAKKRRRISRSKVKHDG